MTDEIKCPKCGSTQIHADKKGFSGSKAAAGAILTGGIGLLAGTIGSNKIKITCLNCGNEFAPGDTKYSKLRGSHAGDKPLSPRQKKAVRIIAIIFGCILSFVGLLMIIGGITGPHIMLIIGAVFIFIAVAFFVAARKRKPDQ